MVSPPSTRFADRRISRGKNPSISLAAGLIMAAESPKNSPVLGNGRVNEISGSKNLFYAYARRSDYAQFSPYLLTFVNVDVARQWWELVQQHYSDSTREGTQLFTFKGDDIPGQIWDNPKFEHLKNKWFYSHFGDLSGTGGVIPLQDERGNLIGQQSLSSSSSNNNNNSNPWDIDTFSPNGDSQTSPRSSTTNKPFDSQALQDTLAKMTTMIEQNTSQIKALSVAQSDGLQRMQQINEMNATQIKSLAANQSELQSLINKNASQFIALTNAQFAHQQQVKEVLQQNAVHVKQLAKGQEKLADACAGMMGAVESLGRSVNCAVLPGPRKLNRKVVAYTYQAGAGTAENGVGSRG